MCLALGLELPLQGTTYHVAQRNPQAADNSPGTLEQPWKTLAQAAKQVQPGDTVLIHGGVYRESVAMKTAGTAEKPICFQAALGEQVVLTGADQLT
ncbi:MAG TPA: chondroitinase-B domain-containing protein, partial [Candidatus Sulfotelmatobacter sp.]|nr:chondroitinase-B domain-containing protein [Candidatus Sulfotelmatobacter sp.]